MAEATRKTCGIMWNNLEYCGVLHGITNQKNFA